MEFEVGCTLEYETEAALTPFVFNLEAARFPRQQIKAERLVTTPDLGVPDRFTMPESGNRLTRFVVPRGKLRVDYTATSGTCHRILVVAADRARWRARRWSGPARHLTDKPRPASRAMTMARDRSGRSSLSKM